MLRIERNQIVQSEAVVAGHEIDALLGLALLVLINIGAPRQPKSHCTRGSVVAFEKSSDVVAKFSVPFLPAIPDKVANLIKAGSVPISRPPRQ
jgi:hypothetical protein